jgi:ABC-type multidrug transport system fused ATPase/permease subunit
MKCDKIIVMDNAKVIEFDEPKKLYENNNSMFRQLCNSSDVII